MDKLDWLETFELGIPEVDDDHRKLLAIMKQIETTAEAEGFDQCKDLLDELIDFSIAHFRREEQMLVKMGYPTADLHKEYHDKLLYRAIAVKNVCKGISSRENFKECCHEMFGFLVDDIVTGDLKFKSYFEDKGLIKRS